MKKSLSIWRSLPIFLLLIICHLQLRAQYFGQNKPAYKVFNFKVYKTPHFEIYHYFNNDSVLNRLAQLSEQWHKIHQTMFKDTLSDNPIIFYANHADFQQTTAISGDIDVGTGGVTEALKNRIVLPIAGSYAQTDHVLGHEMVHAFQYHLLLSGDSGSLNNLRYLPLWMIEGMAEYLSIGSVDANTAMWMRDAIANNDFPTLQQMSQSYKYFPYRYGQCFWAMVGRTWGDSVIVPLFKETAQYGYELALRHRLGYDERTISGMWKTALVNHYQKYLDVALTIPVGNKILFSKNAGDMNISPAISPDGKYVIFLSEKDVFSFDLYLADAHTGKIIRKVSSTVHNSEIDAFNYIESAGTWSPDGKRFAFPVFAGGINKLVVVNVKRGKVLKEYTIPGVPAFNNPAWSPDGDKIILSGMVDGKNSLFTFDLNKKTTEQITFDNFSYLQPTWSSDGKFITFSTDRPVRPGPVEPHGGMNLGIMNMDTREIKIFDVFEGAKNLNPLFSPDDKSIYFLSNRDGFRNMYRYSIDQDNVYQMTKFFTGISGITEFSPAVSVSKDLISYSYFYGGKYSIYSATPNDFKSFQVKRDSLNFDAATLPPLQRTGVNIVDNNIANKPNMAFMSRDSFSTHPYKPKFRLDYITNTGVGVGASRFGAGMAGSIFAIFSDIVGQNQLFATLAVNGEIYDIGGQFAYLNSKHKVNWGASISHIPYLSVYYSYGIDQNGILQQYFDYYRIFEDKISIFGMRPLSRVHRIEFGASAAWYYYRIDRFTYSYYNSSRQKFPAPPGLNIQGVDAAFVGDNSYFGMTAPMRGFRYRFGVEGYTGSMNYIGLTIDDRNYIYQKPFTFAYRLYHYGRYGNTSQFLYPLYLGYPWLVRGYDAGYISQNATTDTTAYNINNLSGSRIAVANVEIRVPLSGPKKIALIKSNYFLTDFALFCDAGLAWDKNSPPTLKWNSLKAHTPIVSTGASLRVNVLGALVIEPYYAFPLRFGGLKHPVFGLNFLPGW